MSIVVQRVDNLQFPIIVTMNGERRRFTELAANELVVKIQQCLGSNVPVTIK